MIAGAAAVDVLTLWNIDVHITRITPCREAGRWLPVVLTIGEVDAVLGQMLGPGI